MPQLVLFYDTIISFDIKLIELIYIHKFSSDTCYIIIMIIFYLSDFYVKCQYCHKKIPLPLQSRHCTRCGMPL